MYGVQQERKRYDRTSLNFNTLSRPSQLISFMKDACSLMCLLASAVIDDHRIERELYEACSSLEIRNLHKDRGHLGAWNIHCII